jgi:hypothetical protein
MALTAEEAEYLLKQILADEQRRVQAILRPYVHALMDIEYRKPPHPTQMPDGRFMVYCGPKAEEIVGAYKAPGWLEDMCREDMRIAHDLRRFRERA